MIPNFLIIGAQKAGTTSLINYISNHSDIFVPEDKEISCFYDDEKYNKRFNHFPYVNYYNNWNGQKYAGNAPVNVLYFAEKTAKLIYKFNPSIKLIAILRNPVERAYSAYWYFVRNGLEKESFESAIAREKDILRQGDFKELSNFTYMSHGFYHEQLQCFLKYFDKKQLLILIHDDLKLNPADTLKELYAFLEVEECIPDNLFDKKYNRSAKPKIQILNNLIYQDHPIKKFYKKIFPESFRYNLRISLIRNLLEKNLEPYKYPPMQSATKQYLLMQFNASNNDLQRLLGKDLSQWNS